MNDKKKENLFAKLAVQQSRAAEAALAVESPVEESPPSPAPPPRVTQTSKPPAEKKPQTVGRRSDPDYCQFNTYIPKTLRRAVERALLDHEGMDNSSLVESLLRKWLKSQGLAE
jgi:hypothetical protein